MVAILAPAAVAAVIAFFGTPLAAKLSARIGAMDAPGPRKVHEVPIPRLGGLAVIAGVAAGTAVAMMVGGPLDRLPADLLVPLTVGLLPIFAISLADDLRPLPALPKFGAQVAGAAIAVAMGVSLSPTIHLFGSSVHIGTVAAAAISIVWIVGVTNAFNIVDGLDGLSAGLALISAVSLAAISAVEGRRGLAAAATLLAGALLGFLPRNTYPARIFLGDSGATSIGFWLACLALRGGSTLSSGLAILVPVVALGFPIAETLLSMARRGVRRLERGAAHAGMFTADRDHVHHRLLALGIDHRRAVRLIYLFGVLAAVAASASMFMTAQNAALLLVTLLAAAFIGVARLGYDEFAVVRRGIVLRFYEMPVVKRALFPVFFDLVLVGDSVYGALVLKTGDPFLRGARGELMALLAWQFPVTLAAFVLLKLYRGMWRHASVEDLLRASAASLLSCAGTFVLTRMAGVASSDWTVFAIDALLLMLLVNGARLSYRVLHERQGRARTSGEPIAIYGAGSAGAFALRETMHNEDLELRPVAFLDDDPEKWGRFFQGLPVLGSVDAIPRAKSDLGVAGLLVSSEKIGDDTLTRLHRSCRQNGLWMRRFRVGIVHVDEPERAPLEHPQ